MTAPDSWHCALPKLPVLQRPDPDAEQASELLFGERVQVSERVGAWSKVSARRDGYTGWVDQAALRVGDIPASHRVGQPSGLVFTRPDIKSPLLARYFFSSPLTLGRVQGDFHAVENGGFIHRRHVAVQAAVETDAVDVASGFLHAPYLWGGRTCDGIDCSALVQTALQACGIACPRDTGEQRVSFADRAVSGEARRGDLVFFPGHVGMMVDGERLLHANAFWMATVIEPLVAVIERFQPAVADPILAFIRLT